MNVSLGIDLGGTKLRGARCEGLAERIRGVKAGAHPSARGLIGEVRRERVGDRRDPRSVARRVAVLVERLLREGDRPVNATPLPVGVGIAGMPSGRGGFIVEAPNLGWTDVPFGTLLGEVLGPETPLRVVNDVNAVTYGEFALGAGAGSRNVLAVYVGTGVGGGLVCNGGLVEGACGSAGEIGHFRVVRGPGARLCGCGKRGCVEAYAGGRALGQRIESELAEGAGSAAIDLAGAAEDVTVEHVDRAAAAGDSWAVELWEEIAELLGVAIGSAVSLLNPERLVFGGGVFWRTPHLRERVSHVLREAAVRAAVESLSIESAVLGDDAGIVGAALLAEQGR